MVNVIIALDSVTAPGKISEADILDTTGRAETARHAPSPGDVLDGEAFGLDYDLYVTARWMLATDPCEVDTAYCVILYVQDIMKR